MSSPDSERAGVGAIAQPLRVGLVEGITDVCLMAAPSSKASMSSSAAELARKFEIDESIVEETPFVLSGSVDHIVDKIE